MTSPSSAPVRRARPPPLRWRAAGYAVVLIDKQIFPREKLCGDFVSPINWPIFRDLGVEERLLAQPHTRVTGFRITSYCGAKRGSNIFPGWTKTDLSVSASDARNWTTCCFNGREEAGVTIRTGQRVKQISKHSKEWQLDMGAGESWRAKILVGADGRNSWVAQQLGMNTRAAMRGRSVGFQTRIHGSSGTDGQIEIHLFPGRLCGSGRRRRADGQSGLAIDERVLPRVGVDEFLRTRAFGAKSVSQIGSRAARESSMGFAPPIPSTFPSDVLLPTPLFSSAMRRESPSR